MHVGKELPFDVDKVRILLSTHFRRTKMGAWEWGEADLREALREVYRVDRVGRSKFEVWVRKHGSKKIVFAYYPDELEINVITGTEG